MDSSLEVSVRAGDGTSPELRMAGVSPGRIKIVPVLDGYPWFDDGTAHRRRMTTPVSGKMKDQSFGGQKKKTLQYLGKGRSAPARDTKRWTCTWMRQQAL